VELLLGVSRSEIHANAASEGQLEGRSGVRTHLAVQALLGCAAREASRRSLLRECWYLLAGRGPYAGSREELTPVAADWLSFIPPTVTALWLLATPAAAHYLPRKGWGAHLLTPQTVRTIRSMDAGGRV
jgi:hypothetical protein